MEEYYTAGELAAIARVSPRTIRYYDQKNLLTPVGYSEGKYRLYDKNSLIQLQEIVMLKYIGLSLEEISTIMQKEKDIPIRELLWEQKKLLLQKQEQLQQVIRTLDEVAGNCEDRDIELSELSGLIKLVTVNDMAYRRFNLWECCGVHQEDWYPWLFRQLGLKAGEAVLDIGSGSGLVWERSWGKIPRNVHIHMVDKFEGGLAYMIAFKDVFLTKMGLYLLGGILVLYGYSSVAVLLAFMEYFSAAMNTFLAMMDGYIRQGELEPALKRIENQLLEAEEGIISGVEQDEPFTELTAEDVSFSYEAVSLLEHTNLYLKSGQCLVILGKSGSGKSTLARLLVGLLIPEQGKIQYNGLDRSSYVDKTFFKQTGIVMQDSYLFNLSIRENLLIGNSEAAEEDMWRACEQTCFADFVRTLPQGMETLIGENGIRLSGGQRQRLVLARMILHHPEILILDEALSALDSDHEKKILQNIRAAMQSGILLIITHRRESLKNLGEFMCLEL